MNNSFIHFIEFNLPANDLSILRKYALKPPRNKEFASDRLSFGVRNLNESHQCGAKS